MAKPTLRPPPLPKPPNSYFFSKPCRPFAQGFLLSRHKKDDSKESSFVITLYLALSGERSEWTDACGIKAWKAKAYEGTSSLPQRR